MTLEELVPKILDTIDKGCYFDTHMVITSILLKPKYRLVYLKDYPKNCEIRHYHEKIANLIKGTGKVEPIGNQNTWSFDAFGSLLTNQLWQKTTERPKGRRAK